jgi:hypothetical protein
LVPQDWDDAVDRINLISLQPQRLCPAVVFLSDGRPAIGVLKKAAGVDLCGFLHCDNQPAEAKNINNLFKEKNG